MDISQKILSDIGVFTKYARHLKEIGRRESFEEIVSRNYVFHSKRFPEYKKVLLDAYARIQDRKILPSMRSMQFAGKPIEINPSRIYNCAYLPIDDWRAFPEIMFLLLGGTGVGYSIQKHHIEKLPEIKKPSSDKRKRFLVNDSIEGWADAVKALMKAYFSGTQRILFDFSDIREKGAPLITAGGKAPGPGPLRDCLIEIEKILERKEDRSQLTSLEVHDILCHIADAVLAGGIRRAALISLFSAGDNLMMSAKSNFNILSWRHESIEAGVNEFGEPVERIVWHQSNGDKFCDLRVLVKEPGKDEYEKICYWVSEKDYKTLQSKNYLPWYYFQPQRGRANNSVVLMRHKITKSYFLNIWKKIEDSRAGEPGIYLSNDKDWGTNPSLRAGTKVLTTEGIFPIEELENKEFFVKNLDGKESKARCWLSGRDQKLWKITLEDGHEYYSTMEHEWPVLKDGNWVKQKTNEIKSGDKLPFLRETSLFKSNFGSYNDGLLCGWIIGDGCVSDRGTHKQYNMVFSPKDGVDNISSTLLETIKLNCPSFSGNIIEEIRSIEIDEDHGGELVLRKVGKKTGMKLLGANNKEVCSYISQFGQVDKRFGLPQTVWTGSEEFRKGIIDGLFSSDGSVGLNHKKRITLSSVYLNLLEDVSELLGFYGIKSKIHRRKERVSNLTGKLHSGFDLRICETESIRQFSMIFKFSVPHKQKRLDSYEYNNTNIKNYVEIISVEETSITEDVWDISVYDDTHCFQISKCITGNCCEIALRPFQFCNLVEINGGTVENQQDFNDRCYYASMVATFQASVTDFHYLRPIWKKTTEKDSLLGVGITGIGSNKLAGINLQEGVDIVKNTNIEWAGKLGINPAARLTTIKPSGTSSIVLGTSSGIHSWFAKFYKRRMRVGKNESIYKYLVDNFPCLVEDDYFRPNDSAIVTIPQKSPEGAILRTEESALDLLERVKYFSKNWVKPGHISGNNTHNVSATISVKEGEWESTGEWMWKNREYYNGLSVLPFDGGTYIQAPFEEITEKEYDDLMSVITDSHLENFDLKNIKELEDITNLAGELACAGGNCEI